MEHDGIYRPDLFCQLNWSRRRPRKDTEQQAALKVGKTYGRLAVGASISLGEVKGEGNG
jgi:hypothetical protein